MKMTRRQRGKNNSGAPRAREVRLGGAPKLSKSTRARKFGNHVTVPVFTLTLLASLGAQEKTNCPSML